MSEYNITDLTQFLYTLPHIFNGILLFVIKLAIFLHLFDAAATLALTSLSNPASQLIIISILFVLKVR